MNPRIESVLRFLNLTASGLLAGSLGFGTKPLVPGWKNELPRERMRPYDRARNDVFNAIGPLALGTAVTLAVGSKGASPWRRTLDTASAIGLAGVLVATTMVTVPINRKLDQQPASDYPSDRSQSLTRNWARAQAVRRTLGVGAFFCAVVANIANRRRV